MIRLGKVELKNCYPFKQATFDLDYKGVTVVRGRNLNVMSPNASNAAGKSRLLSVIPTLLFEEPPISVGKRFATKDIFGEETVMSVEVNGQTIIKKTKGASVKYEVHNVDGDKGLRTKSFAAADIAKLFPVSEEEFYTYGYIDSRRVPAFQIGTPAKRFAFFTDLFRINDYDTIRGYFRSLISEIEKSSKLRESLEIEVVDLLKEIKTARTTAKTLGSLAELQSAEDSSRQQQKKLFDEIRKYELSN
jgi:hypothetical protein